MSEIPDPIAASSLDRPDAINIQNRRRCSCRATGGRPGDLNLPRSARSERRRPAIATALRRLLRRPLESTQYCSNEYQAELRGHGIVISMSGKGNCFDNAVVETFFKTLKSELVWRTTFQTRAEAVVALARYIDGFYNPRRRHSVLGFTSPTQFEKGFTHETALQ
jgi:putative transposase